MTEQEIINEITECLKTHVDFFKKIGKTMTDDEFKNKR